MKTTPWCDHSTILHRLSLDGRETVSMEAAQLMGDEPSVRVPSLVNPQNLLWPSDHAGVAARLRLR